MQPRFNASSAYEDEIKKQQESCNDLQAAVQPRAE